MKGTLSRVLLLILALTLPALPAAAQDSPRIAPRQASLLGSLWHFLEGLVPAASESHVGMDPDGKPAAESQTPLEDPAPDSHAGMDPDGKS